MDSTEDVNPQLCVRGRTGGSLADRVEFLDARGRRIGVFTLDDFKRSRDAGFPPILVISPGGPHLASGELWRKTAQEWDGPLPKHPVSYGGGDGSSLKRAVIVHSIDLLDHVLAGLRINESALRLHVDV